MNAVNDTRELTEAELDFVAGGAPPYYVGNDAYDLVDLLLDFANILGHCCGHFYP